MKHHIFDTTEIAQKLNINVQTAQRYCRVLQLPKKGDRYIADESDIEEIRKIVKGKGRPRKE